MSSNINPNNINGAYPIAGQDNDSQGFRDNFTNIRTNLAYAKDEISELQSKVVLTASLGSGSGTVTNDMSNSILSRARTTGFTESVYALSPGVGNVSIEYTLGDIQTMTMPAGNITLAFTGWPTATYATIKLWVKTLNTTNTITFPNEVVVGLVGLPGVSGHVLTPTIAGDYLFEFGTIDGGSTIYVEQLLGPVNSIVTTLQGNVSTLTSNVTTLQGNVTFTSNDVANATAISLSTTCSYFTTAGPETATLAAGTYGQRKILSAVDVTAGPMVVTVANPGWGGAGTITFATNGEGCELIYHNSKWFCIGRYLTALA